MDLFEESFEDPNLTRVLHKGEPQYNDHNTSSDFESDHSYVPAERPSTPRPKIRKEVMNAISSEEVQELLHKCHLSEEDTEEEVITEIEEKQEDEINLEQNNYQKKKTQKTQRKKTAKGVAKNSKNDEPQKSLEDDKSKKETKSKNNKPTNANLVDQSEEGINMLEYENKEVPSDNNQKDENINTKKTKPKDKSADKEKKTTAKSKSDKGEIINKKDTLKTSNDKHAKGSESNNLNSMESQVEGRVLRSRRAKEANEPLPSETKNSSVQNKKLGKKAELDTQQPKEDIGSTEMQEDIKTMEKKKTGKKVVSGAKKLEEESASAILDGEKTANKSRKNGKKVTSEIKEIQGQTVPTIVKENSKNNPQRKNDKKTLSQVEQNEVEKELTKNTKAKRKPTNAKSVENLALLPMEHQVTEKQKSNSKPGLAKNKIAVENKENKIDEMTVPNKRAGRKK